MMTTFIEGEINHFFGGFTHAAGDSKKENETIFKVIALEELAERFRY